MFSSIFRRAFNLKTTACSPRRRQSVQTAVPAIIETLETRKLLSGQTIIVNTAADDAGHVITQGALNNPGSVQTLRDAILTAEHDLPGDTIQFTSKLAGDTITATTGNLPTITQSMTINGGNLGITIAGYEKLVEPRTLVKGQATEYDLQLSPVFVVANPVFGSNVTIGGLSITDINGSDPAFASVDRYSGNGAGVVNQGNLTLNWDNIVNCVTTGNGGGINNTGALNVTDSNIVGGTAYGSNTSSGYDTTVTGGISTSTGLGGGIFNSGTVTLESSSIYNNLAAGNGGGIYNTGMLTISSGAWINANNTSGNGGGIYNAGDASTSNSYIESNTANNSGGGVFNASAATVVDTSDDVWSNKAVYGSGGGIYNQSLGTFESTDDSIESNMSPRGDGGGVFNSGKSTMSTVSIIENFATAGGGVFSNNGSLVFNDGGKISLNSAALNTGVGLDVVGGTLQDSGLGDDQLTAWYGTEWQQVPVWNVNINKF